MNSKPIRWMCSWIVTAATLIVGANARADAPTKQKPAAKPRQPSSHERLLKVHGIATDAKGLAIFLRKLRPSSAERRHAQQLVRQLGSAVYAERDAASRQLAAMAMLPIQALTKAAESTDLEVSWRAKKLLGKRSSQQTAILYAIFSTISDRRLPGLVAELVASIPVCKSEYVIRSAQRAVVMSARGNDANTLRSAIQDDNVLVQAAAVEALARVLGRDALADLQQLLGPPNRDDRVVLAAAIGLANLGERSALPALLKLLSSDNVFVRAQAALALRASTGKNFGFASYARPAARTAVVDQWRVWIAANQKTARLTFPLNIAPQVQSHLHGNTLLACGYKNNVVEYTPEWNAVFTYKAVGAFGAEKLPNGNFLIACYGPNEVIEVTPEKKVVWRMKFKACLNARPLANGNFLIAGHTSKQVLEVNRDQKTVWQYKSKWNCYDAHRLANGNTMISSERGVEEVSPEGRIVWDYSPGHSFYGCQPLANGNVLLAAYSTNEVTEISRAKKVVWKYNVGHPFDAFRLPNGNTLVVTNSNSMEVTPEGKTLWSRAGNTHGRIRR